MANQFIAYNEDQIPMTCKANTQKNGMGEIELHEVNRCWCMMVLVRLLVLNS